MGPFSPEQMADKVQQPVYPRHILITYVGPDLECRFRPRSIRAVGLFYFFVINECTHFSFSDPHES